jgi:hypothetical protein
MPNIPELLSGHVTLEVECLGRLYLNGYIGPLATSGGLVTFMREQLGKPIPSPVVLGVFRPAMAMFTANDAVLPFPLRRALDRLDAQLDRLIYDALPLPKAG